ncbi:DUF4129 domain-containing protein [Egicoccus sp. AB-alg2]|uniref:DUF4129 domain-containing protein n=1 Tax=Egicoccus sp. AB-alg2 TaxID=3242693 RepID=UPI00359DC4C1
MPTLLHGSGVVAAAAPLRHDPEVLRDTARELLSRPPYTEQAPGPVTDVLLRLRQWIAGVLDAVLGAVAGNTGFAWAVVAAGTGLLVVLAIRWSRGLTLDRADAVAPVGEPGRTASDWRREATAHAEVRAWSEAVRAGYAAVVADLVAAGVLTDAGGRTVGEIDRQVTADDPTSAPAVRRAGRVFEDVWYGHRQAGEDDFRAVVAAWRTERAGAATRGRAAADAESAP